MTTTDTPATLAAIERQLDFRASRDRLWRALTEDDELAEWFGQRAHLDLRPGGDGWMEFDGYGRVPIRIEAIDPLRRLAWRWGDPGVGLDEGHATLVEFELESLADGGTRLRVRETGFRREAERWDHSEGWLSELAELATHVADEPWQAGIRRTEVFTSSVDRVWAALGEPAGLAAWWSGVDPVDVRPGAEGWWRWDIGSHAYRIETVEPPRYLCWSWVTERDVPLADAPEVLRTEWALVSRDDGGTDLHLFESGFKGPKSTSDNSEGWQEMLGQLRKAIGEA
ncbi:MAG TPA: SRPBCC family protein [Candidatus Limnocylindrales bacterium]